MATRPKPPSMADERDSEGLAAMISRLAAEGNDYARAELRAYRAGMADRITAARTAAILFVGAIVLALATLVALLVGLILALATLIGAAGATAVVVLAMLLLAGLMGWIGVGRIKHALRKEKK
ncbi:phage holin family protein [Sphingomonas sp.]|uniref:phage holin family protein n=1 Tax=Sphingomonas sp. TaxID=28214 RepID=UPI0025FE6496|nr:phage holin family protein [Sphingomonas sp.]